MLKHMVAASVAALISTSAFAVPISGQGTWETTLQGRDLDGDLSNGYEAYYDTTLDLTWMADANWAQTSGYDHDGRLSWYDSVKWLRGFSAYDLYGWRLPVANPVNGESYDLQWKTDGSTDRGVNYATTASELAHMYYVTLGNSSLWSTDEVYTANPGIIINTGPFKNIDTKIYPYQTQSLLDDVNEQSTVGMGQFVFAFATSTPGMQTLHSIDHHKRAWLVRPGDVTDYIAPPLPGVPEPGTIALAVAGVAAVLVGRKRGRTPD